MRKVLGVALLFGFVGGVGYLLYTKACSPASARGCARLAKLCQTEKVMDRPQCEQLFERIEQAAGAAQAVKTTRCLDESESCAGAMGCLVGAGFGAAGEFMKGMRRAIEDR